MMTLPLAHRHPPLPMPAATRAAASRAPRAWRIRTTLALLAVACLLPGALMSAYFIVADYQQNKDQAVRDVITVARATAANLDRDLVSVASGLRVLATSPALAEDDLARFYEQARRALPYQDVMNYVLVDATGRQRLNTLRGWGEPLPAQGGSPDRRFLVDHGTPVVTDLFTGPVTGRSVMAIRIPVLVDDRPVYNLSAGILPERVAKLLHAQQLPAPWLVTVLDGRAHVVARTRDMQRFLARPAMPAVAQAVHQRREGVLETLSLDGVPMLIAYSRSTVSSWTVTVGIPLEQLTAGLKRSVALLLAANAVVFALALSVAWHLAQSRVMRPARQLLQRMQRMSQGGLPQAPAAPNMPGTPSGSLEFAQLEEGFIEMSERLHQREQEREAQRAAEAANMAKTQFLSRMSHELRTPLNAVLGFAQVLRLDPRHPLTERQLAMVQEIESSGRHLLAMIGDVLDVSRIESGQMSLTMEDLPLGPLIRDCHAMMAGEAEAAGIELDVSGEGGDTVAVHADRTRLKQVLLNLVSNGIKYNRPGGRVSLRARAADGRVYFSVEDTGMGLSPTQLARLFEPFNRLGRETGSAPGTGIGLVICQQLVGLMGGTLQVDSKEHQGSRFYFDLAGSDAP